MDCGREAGLREIRAEADPGGASIRFRYLCCSLDAAPIAVRPVPVPLQEAFLTTSIQSFEGIYCPTRIDGSGRPSFQQKYSFKNMSATTGSTLSYDRRQGLWCLQDGGRCAPSDAVHPLEALEGGRLGGLDWQVVRVSNFNTEFESRGVRPPPAATVRLPAKPPKPPSLIRFEGIDPEVAEECKDESHPGTETFDAERMSEVASGLGPENPCHYVSMSWTNRKDKTEQNAITYRTVKECSDREIEAALAGARTSRDQTAVDLSFQAFADIYEAVGAFLPNSHVNAIFGGLGIKTGAQLAAAAKIPKAVASLVSGAVFADKRINSAEDDAKDCSSLQHGLARAFCDVHCVRDAVKSGDAAIRESLESAVEVMGENMKLLFDFYLGGSTDATANALTQSEAIRSGITTRFQEMRTMAASLPLNLAASSASQRAVTSFSSRMKEMREAIDFTRVNASLQCKGMAEEVHDLHRMLLHLTSTQGLTSAQSVQRSSAEYVRHMNGILKTKAHTLGIYRHASLRREGREGREGLHGVVKMSELLVAVQEQSLSSVLQALDSTWWQLRRELDRYLDAIEACGRHGLGFVDLTVLRRCGTLMPGLPLQVSERPTTAGSLYRQVGCSRARRLLGACACVHCHCTNPQSRELSGGARLGSPV